MEFIGEEVDGARATQKIRGETSPTSTFISKTAAALHVDCKSRETTRKVKRSTEKFCVFCELHGHWAQDCKSVTDVKGRIEKLKAAIRCFLCLNRGHRTNVCAKDKAFCSSCRKGHHRSVGMDPESTTRQTSAPTSVSVGTVDAAATGFTYLQTARVWVTGPTGLRLALSNGPK
jgi:hypothetical protein